MKIRLILASVLVCCFSTSVSAQGTGNTVLGSGALQSDTTGSNNTALGEGALHFNIEGFGNTSVGFDALYSNLGTYNVALGMNALYANTSGTYNAAFGPFALESNRDGYYNTAIGVMALDVNTSGSFNTALGPLSLNRNTTGNGNLALGMSAMQSNTTGSYNIAIGNSAGGSLQTGNYNICIGAAGSTSDNGTMRFGTTSSQTRTFIAGIRGVTTGGRGIPVLIDSNGQLGTVSSSIRFKEEVRDMGDRTSHLYDLRPVTFRYKSQSNGDLHFGLIAEEVDKVLPELVVRSEDGQIETVAYHELAPMLLNELQKQKREIAELKQKLEAVLQRLNP